MFKALCSIVAVFCLLLWAALLCFLGVLLITVSALVELFAKVLPIIIAGVALAAIYHYFINPLW